MNCSPLHRELEGRIVLVVMDGLGGYPEPGRPTELDAAHTPNLDRLVGEGSLRLGDPVAPGITPGSGPGHMALFGYDPVGLNVGRELLVALGWGLALTVAVVLLLRRAVAPRR